MKHCGIQVPNGKKIYHDLLHSGFEMEVGNITSILKKRIHNNKFKKYLQRKNNCLLPCKKKSSFHEGIVNYSKLYFSSIVIFFYLKNCRFSFGGHYSFFSGSICDIIKFSRVILTKNTALGFF